MTAEQRRMWLLWARGLDSLGTGPRPIVHPTVAGHAPRRPPLMNKLER